MIPTSKSFTTKLCAEVMRREVLQSKCAREGRSLVAIDVSKLTKYSIFLSVKRADILSVPGVVRSIMCRVSVFKDLIGGKLSSNRLILSRH